MAEVTIELRTGPGGFRIRVSLESDPDALPHEHERLHRRLVGELLPGLDLAEDPRPTVEVRRERPAQEPVVG